MKVKRLDLKNIKNVFDKIKLSDKISIKLGLVLYRNTRKLEEELSFISNELPRLISDETREFERKKEEILLENCKRNEDGSPIIVNGNYSFEPDKFRLVGEQIETYISSLSEETREKIQKELEDIRKFFEEEVEIDLEQIDSNIVPDGVMDYGDIEILMKYDILKCE